MNAAIIRNAIVLAAGRGERLRPLTDRIPKPLVPVAGQPLIDRALDQLARHGIAEAVVNVSYKAELLTAYLAGRTRPTLTLSHEDVPLETGGGIAHALPLLGTTPFFSLNSDTICVDPPGEGALAQLERAWDERVMDALLLLHPVERAIGYDGAGDFVVEDDKLRRRLPAERAPYVFTGIQILHPRLFEGCPDGAFSMNRLYDRLRDAAGYFTRLAYVVHRGDWLHVGDPPGLQQAEAYFNTA